MYHEREAELQARVDRARVRIVPLSAGERREALAALRDFSADVSGLPSPIGSRSVDIDAACERAAAEGRA